jgi:multidrug efflux pump subunit AcrA (membrane-fusion protein)
MNDHTPQASGPAKTHSYLPAPAGGDALPQVGTVRPVEARKSASLVHRLGPVVFRSLVSVLLIAGSLAIFGMLGRGSPPPTRATTAAAKPMVEVLPVERHVGGIDFDVDGVVIPFQQVDVPAEVAGRIASRSDNCRIGRTVKRDELLLTIDPQDYELEVRRLQEQLKQAQAQLHELTVETAARQRQIELAREDLAIKQREVQRYENINDPGVYTKSELDSVRLKELQARDSVQTELDQLELLQSRHERLNSACDFVLAQLEKARLDLSRSKVRSPIAGVITREPLERGVYVQRGGTVAVVQNTSCMEIRCSLHMRQMQWLWQSAPRQQSAAASNDAYHLPETPVTVFFEVGATRYAWKGSLAYFDGAQVDQKTRMVPCRVYVRDPGNVLIEAETDAAGLESTPIALMAGMFVTVRVHARPALSLMRLPEIAVQPGNEVWTVRPNSASGARSGRLHKTAIRVAHASRDVVLAYAHGSDLSPGDLLVVSPLASPVENASVEIREPR